MSERLCIAVLTGGSRNFLPVIKRAYGNDVAGDEIPRLVISDDPGAATIRAAIRVGTNTAIIRATRQCWRTRILSWYLTSHMVNFLVVAGYQHGVPWSIVRMLGGRFLDVTELFPIPLLQETEAR